MVAENRFLGVPFNDPGRSVQEDIGEINEAIARVLQSGWFILGPENDALALELSAHTGVGHSVLVGNGTDALEIAMRSVGVRAGDGVITVANAGGYASTAIHHLGALPHYVDIEPTTLQMDPARLRELIEERDGHVHAVVVTHLFGQVAPVLEIVEIAKAAGLLVIEDCAQAFGAKVDGISVGAFGDIATTSFYPTKNLAGLGDGGAVFTSNSYFAERATQLRQYGWADRYDSNLSGGRNSRLDEIQASILRLRLGGVQRLIKKRQSFHLRYREVDSPWGFFPHAPSEEFVAHLSVIVSDRRDELADHLARWGVGSSIHYPIPDYRQAAFFRIKENLPVTELMSKKILSVPVFSEIRDEEVSRVCEALGATSLS